jgi:hypothetical protein
MDNTGIKNWNKPELIVLVRNNPEEKVLSTCKGTNIDGSLNDYDNCMGPMSLPCNICSVIGDS